MGRPTNAQRAERLAREAAPPTPPPQVYPGPPRGITLSPELLERVKRIAVARNRSVDSLVEYVLTEYAKTI